MPADDTAAFFDIADSSDEDVVRQVLAGQTAMYELLMRRHNERLYRAARAITRNDGESEEVMQQTYVSAFANLHQFNGHARFAPWLTRIAINESLATVRRRVKYEPIDDDSIASTGPRCLPCHQTPSDRRSPVNCATCWSGRSTAWPMERARSSSCAKSKV